MNTFFLTANRRVIHTRLTHFAVTVERLVDPALLTRPLAVISSAAQSGTIVDLSAEARQEGLAPGMAVGLARKISRATVLMPLNRALYGRLQGALLGRLTRFSPAVEPVGYGRFFLDMAGMTGIYRSSEDAARLLLRDLATQLDLAPAIGIGKNKLVSAIAARTVAARTRGTGTVREVPPGDEVRFLAPLATAFLPIAAEQPVRQSLDDLNLQWIRQLQRLADFEHLCKVAFDPFARQVAAQARGIDTSLVRPIQLGDGSDTIIKRHTLPEDTNDEARLRAAVQQLADGVGYNLRRRQMIAGKVTLSTHYTDGYQSAAIGRLKRNDAITVTGCLLALYERSNRRRNRVRAITVEAAGLRPRAQQLDLFDTAPARDQRLTVQIDRLRDRYGSAAVRTGLTLR